MFFDSKGEKMDSWRLEFFRKLFEDEEKKKEFGKTFPGGRADAEGLKQVIDLLDRAILDFLNTEPQSKEELAKFLLRYLTVALNFGSGFVKAVMLCVYEMLKERYGENSIAGVEVEYEGESVTVERGLEDTLVFYRNLFAAYLGEPLKDFLDFQLPKKDTPSS
ncbi:hypothetical protein KJ885_03960 [Patescibacteria group bacterium]|nr:hypothetical protein [Patescibacteria group bacterium]